MTSSKSIFRFNATIHKPYPLQDIPFLCISRTRCRIKFKFLTHIKCDSLIILHNNTKIVWGYPMQIKVKVRPNFPCVCNVISWSFHIKRASRYNVILVMQMKVKVQTSFCFVSQEPRVHWNPNSSCTCYVLSQTYHMT